ncbi:MAG: MarR family transcriptional regulator [Spirochaetales bacterium]|nr:MarR family transcriptional regulator [Spirochaetales bacterium]
MERASDSTEELPETLKLDNQLCFSIYAASRAITRAYRPILEQYGLTYPQYLVLLTLWERDCLPVGEIGRRLYLDSGTLTPLLKRMELTGFLDRQRGVADERKVEVRLTEKGKALRQVAVEIPKSLVKETHLDWDEATRTKAMVDQILRKFLDCTSEPFEL